MKNFVHVITIVFVTQYGQWYVVQALLANMAKYNFTLLKSSFAYIYSIGIYTFVNLLQLIIDVSKILLESTTHLVTMPIAIHSLKHMSSIMHEC